MVSGIAIAGILFSLIVSVGVPIALVTVLKVRKKESVLTALAGAAVFILFVMVVESFVNQMMFRTVALLSTNKAAFVIYTCLAAGLFEETGRMCLFFLMKNKIHSPAGAMMYGAGHGGAEAILLVGITCVNNLILVWMLNTQGVEGLTAGLNGAQLVSMQNAIATYTQSPEIFCLAGIERLITIPLHIALSVLVWMAVNKKVPFWFYFIAILLHAVCNLPAALYQTGVLNNIILVEGITALLVLGVMLLAFYQYRTSRPEIDSSAAI
jgi:uncharacterized membrane protein YhfC